jgi:5-methyltetrahydrofolate--homocysteine methyltransferase
MNNDPQELVCTYDPLIELMRRFENVRAVDESLDPFAGMSAEDVLKKHIIDGIKKNLERHLEEGLVSNTPLELINNVLLDGMKTVGELFGSGKMQLPFVLQSAEVMKAAVRYLEPKMEKVEGSEKGSILLATVAGDVHDIGKNLVDIILSNNGYRVVNIGIKQPINNILDKCREHNCQAIGMSGLLVKSTVIMRENLEEMNQRDLSHIPVILGGAALTRGYVEEDLSDIYHGKVFYAKDAFEGLALMEKIGDPGFSTQSGEIEEEIPERPRRVTSHRLPDRAPELYTFDGTKSDVESADIIPELPFYGVKYRDKFDIFELYKFINTTALWRGQWQFKKPADLNNAEFQEQLERDAVPIYERLKRELARVFSPRVAWGYFWCNSQGNDLIVFEEDAKTERTRFNFPRQRDLRRQCLSDFFLPVEAGKPDVVGFQIVTAGSEVSEYERSLFERGEFQDYLFVHGMGVELAEALAEYWHKMMRNELGFGHHDPEELRALFGLKYQGARYSFGYPACPNLDDQKQLFDLLNPEKIGIELSEEFMLVPEQSTSAIVVHHPGAKYFNIR